MNGHPSCLKKLCVIQNLFLADSISNNIVVYDPTSGLIYTWFQTRLQLFLNFLSDVFYFLFFIICLCLSKKRSFTLFPPS